MDTTNKFYVYIVKDEKIERMWVSEVDVLLLLRGINGITDIVRPSTNQYALEWCDIVVWVDIADKEVTL